MTEKEREGCNLLKVSSRDRHLLQRHKPLTHKKKKPSGRSPTDRFEFCPHQRTSSAFHSTGVESENKLLHLLQMPHMVPKTLNYRRIRQRGPSAS